LYDWTGSNRQEAGWSKCCEASRVDDLDTVVGLIIGAVIAADNDLEQRAAMPLYRDTPEGNCCLGKRRLITLTAGKADLNIVPKKNDKRNLISNHWHSLP